MGKATWYKIKSIYNGIKVFTAGGRDADQVVTGKIEAQIALLKPEDVKSIDYDQAMEMGLIREGYPFNEYIDSILQVVDTKKIKRAHLRIAIDPMYGVSQSSLRTILLTCRCDVDVIHEQHDTLFGGKMPAPSADTLKLLSNYVVDNGCNLGVATDGDADRLGVIDEKGAFLHPNTLLVLLYYYLVKYRGWSGPCVRNNSTTHLLDPAVWPSGATSRARTAFTPPLCWWKCWPSPASPCPSCTRRSPTNMVCCITKMLPSP